MSKSGARNGAVDYLEPIYADHHDDPETAGILAGVYKDQFKYTADTHYAQKSLDTYQENFEKTGNYYTGINAATMSRILGNSKQAKELARTVIESINNDTQDFWELATLAEAYLLTNEVGTSKELYLKAAEIGKDRLGMMNSAYGQLRLLQHYATVPKEVMRTFAPPGIAAFTGHMIDAPGRAVPRFPSGIEEQVKSELQKVIEEKQIRIGYTSLASGGDILFAELILESGGEVTAILPFAKEDFLETSVAFAGSEWGERFESLLEKCSTHYITEERYSGEDELFHFSGKIILGLTLLRASSMQAKPYLVTLLSERDQNAKMGGTRSVYEMWPFGEETITNINPDIWVGEQPSVDDIASGDTPSTSTDTKPNREVRYIMFADIVGFSKVQEEQTPFFMHLVLDKVAAAIQDYPKPPILNTWGDAIFGLFTKADHAMNYAFLLLDTFRSIDWTKHDFPDSIDIRVALHAGPVYVATDPLTKRPNGYGTHINKAARMEPVTLPGTIYASEQFAATLTVEAPDKYEYQHVGIIELAKKYGSQEVYRIDKKTKTAMTE